MDRVAHPTLMVSRREFVLALVVGFAGSELLPCASAAAPAIADDDPRIRARTVTVENGAAGLQSYLALPATDANTLASVIVAHDSLGLTPHFQDVARRLAVEGFAALAPDYASRYGGTPAEPGPAREVVDMTTWDEWLADTRAAISWLTKQTYSNGKVCGVGYGLGGRALGRIVFQTDEFKSCVVFYGRVPPLESVRKIKARLLLNYAANDPLVDPEVPGFEDALKRADVDYQAFVYDSTKHGFADETASTTYNKDAAQLAWSRTIDFLKETTA